MKETFRTLYSQGGIPRFYKGLLPALFQVNNLPTTKKYVIACITQDFKKHGDMQKIEVLLLQ